ncbi:heme-containing CO-sensing transcriptional regulator RcoM 1 [Geobacter sp. OR-1]|uniref:LytTR family transcriptional regulator DNA-binding domain-containing protein n=1 Tax=Geobacter sp. OR-1 TaxID=1266765 RepID=UPI00054305E4|nr:LytTR family transcriptional regulator DNA-binding domain-containing protein [Geobacter sp. OR-1]GAM10894.1 heme-containing CO-sensing transcriptional regulator RcoM 1 [Geobacter sp. OR-1]
MENFLSSLNIGLVLLSSDLRVIGMNDFARKVFGPVPDELGRSLFLYHPGKSRELVRGIMREMIDAPPGEARTVIIDVLGRAIMNNLSQLTITTPAPQTCWAVTFIDVTAQTGAVRNPLSGLVEMKKVPVAEGGSYRFIAIDDVRAVQSDGDYCRIFTTDGTYYEHLNLKGFLLRYPSPALMRVHKSFIVNLRHIRKSIRSGSDQLTLHLDHDQIPPIPVSRRRATDLKRALAHL